MKGLGSGAMNLAKGGASTFGNAASTVGSGLFRAGRNFASGCGQVMGIGAHSVGSVASSAGSRLVQGVKNTAKTQERNLIHTMKDQAAAM
mmetsp:Transcript_43013/g.56922  ORF Transcript_43013/g.56922 Transcript_43013/m.56922 type:complete len:90 (+) Transcript_43013:116-385(+)